VIDHEMQKLLT